MHRTQEDRSTEAGRGPSRPGLPFALVIALVLCGLVGLGFYRSFFLRPWFDTYDVRPYVLWHGVAMTAWFFWLVMQTRLIATGRLRRHRTMGWIGVGIGLLAIVSAAAVNWAMLVRAQHAGRDVRAQLATWSDVLWSNAAPLLVFTALFVAAILLRRKRRAHSSLMLLGSVAMLDPALARVGLLPAVEIGGRSLDQWVFPIGMMALLPLLVVIWDWRRSGRPHPATVLGALAVWFAIPALRWIGTTPAGQTVLAWML